MAVLTFLACLLAVRANGLLWAYMHTSEAHGAVVADESFLIRKVYVIHRADAYAGVATDALIGIHFRTQAMNHASFDSRATEEP